MTYCIGTHLRYKSNKETLKIDTAFQSKINDPATCIQLPFNSGHVTLQPQEYRQLTARFHQQYMCTLIVINSHRTISLVVPSPGGIGAVDRDLVVVGSQSMTMSVSIGKETTL